MADKRRKMRIKLRPYHPTWVIAFFGMGQMDEGFNSKGFNDVIDRIRRCPDIEVEFVEGYDDICNRCDRLVEDEKGSLWGPKHTCPSAQNKDVIKGVIAANKRVLQDMGVQFGSVVRMKDLVKLLSERIPILDDEMLGGAEFQKKYEKGLSALRRLYGMATIQPSTENLQG